MTTEMQKLPDDKGKSKYVVEDQSTDTNPPISFNAGPRIRLTLDGERIELVGSDLQSHLPDGVDVLEASDRQIVNAVEAWANENTKSKNVVQHRLYDYSVVRLENGNWLITPPAVYG